MKQQIKIRFLASKTIGHIDHQDSNFVCSRHFSTKQTQPYGHWKEISNQRKYFEELGNKLGINSLDDWYGKLSKTVMLQNNGSGLLNIHNGSPTAALFAAYPEHNWIPWKFKTSPYGFWKSSKNQRIFFDWLGNELGIKELDDWYGKISTKVLESGLLQRHNQSNVAALMAAYPEHNWIPWKFKHVPSEFWKSFDNQKLFFDWLGRQLEIKDLDDWYEKLSANVITSYGGSGILNKYNRSPTVALMATYPDHKWKPWLFHAVPRGFWKSTENQTQFFDNIAKELGIQHLDDWYDKLSTHLIVTHGGGGLLELHRRSPSVALMAAYPEHNWIPWKFNQVESGYWKSMENVSHFVAYLSEKLSIQTLDDWYRVDYVQLRTLGASTLLKQNGLYNVLKEIYPHYSWDPRMFQQKGRKAQRWLVVTLKKMFPNEEVIEDYLHPQIVLPSSKRPMQLDVFIPSRSLAFEYQGIQHFENIDVFGSTASYKIRDDEKRILCNTHNIQLIEVPYWWNRTQQSLQQLITHSNQTIKENIVPSPKMTGE